MPEVVQGVVTVVRSTPGPDLAILGWERSEENIAVTARMGKNYSRMEYKGQPMQGWPINVPRKWCPCRFWLKFGVCIHVQYLIQITGTVDSNGNDSLYDRSMRKKRGRPPKNGPALSYT
ncbi:hypothetical protein PF011_g28111 [Phytophthora fragariae]|uniref:SWIM-type domain-containing protein n=1 Tax=Phytophthora fragariae TaxID=53985 RepID=A0A6A3H8X4_9STRA|nr:hypothetical protein PF003_g21466 [Phytophthora fragariae]KAE8965941.1 hypothetical protein PF011_g28111 [Phytophthora fragariae]